MTHTPEQLQTMAEIDIYGTSLGFSQEEINDAWNAGIKALIRTLENPFTEDLKAADVRKTVKAILDSQAQKPDVDYRQVNENCREYSDPEKYMAHILDLISQESE